VLSNASHVAETALLVGRPDTASLMTAPGVQLVQSPSLYRVARVASLVQATVFRTTERHCPPQVSVSDRDQFVLS
jgi:hypothetical protein